MLLNFTLSRQTRMNESFQLVKQSRLRGIVSRINKKKILHNTWSLIRGGRIVVKYFETLESLFPHCLLKFSRLTFYTHITNYYLGRIINFIRMVAVYIPGIARKYLIRLTLIEDVDSSSSLLFSNPLTWPSRSKKFLRCNIYRSCLKRKK